MTDEKLEADLRKEFEDSWEQLESQEGHKRQPAEAERGELESKIIADFELRMEQDNDRRPDQDYMPRLRIDAKHRMP